MKKKIGQESIPTLLLETLLLVLCVFDTSAICNLPYGYELEFQKLFYLILPAYICSFKKARNSQFDENEKLFFRKNMPSQITSTKFLEC